MAKVKKQQSGYQQLEKSEQKIVRRLYDRFFDLYTARNSLGVVEQWNKWEKQSLPGNAIQSISGSKNDNVEINSANVENPSKLKSPMTWSTIQTVLALAVDQDTEIELIAQSDEDRPKTVILEEVMQYAWEKANGDIERYHFILDACRYGTGIWKEYFRTDTRTIKDIKSWDPTTEKIVYETREIEDYNDVYGKAIDLRMFYVDQMATSMDDARDCFERMILSEESFRQLYPVKKYPNAKYVIPGGYFLGEFDDERTQEIFPEIGEDEIEVVEYWNKIKDERHIVANGTLLTPKVSPIPYKHKQLPYARLVFFPRDRQHFYGLGIAEILEHHQAGRDTVWNIMIDRMKLALNKPLFVSPGTDLTDEDMVIYPGKVTEVPEPSTSVLEMRIDPPDNQSFNIIEKIDQEAKYLIGADDPLFGVKTGGTATENAIAKESSLKKMKVFIRNLEAESMTRIGRLRFSNIQQLYSIPVRIKKIVGKTRLGQFTSGLPQAVQDAIPGRKEVEKLEPEYRRFPIEKKKVKNALNRDEWRDKPGSFVELTPDDYMGLFDVRVVPTTKLPISKEMEKKQWMEMVQGLGALPPAVQLIDWRKLLVDYFWKWDVDGNDFLIDQTSKKEQLIELAVDENDRMIEGEPIPATRGVPPEHSQRHEALIFSQEFKDFDREIQDIITRHYEGELREQQVTDAEGRLEKVKQLGAQQIPVNPETGLPEGVRGSGSMAPEASMNEAMGLQNPEPPIEPPRV